MKKNKVKANIPVLLVVAIIGTVLSVGGTALAMYNWDDAYVADFNFPVNKSSVSKDWVALKGKNSEIQSFQTVGNSKCKYNLYVKQRNGSYNAVYNNMTYSQNEAPSKVYTYSFGNWLDYKFKMNKIQQTGVHSTVKLMVEKPSN